MYTASSGFVAASGPHIANRGATVMDNQGRIEQLLESQHPCIAVVSDEEPYALDLVRQATMGGARKFMVWSVVDGLRDGLLEDAETLPETDHPAAGLYALSQWREPFVAVFLDLCLHLEDGRTRRALRQLIAHAERMASSVVLINATGDLPPEVRGQVTRCTLDLPGEEEIGDIVRRTVKEVHRRTPVEATMARGDFQAVVRNLRGLTRAQVRRVIMDVICDDRRFDAADIPAVLSRKRHMVSAEGTLEFIETPTDLSEVGGLVHLKSWLAERQGALSDEARAFGLVPPRGVLMLGVQGAGKSLCARAIATAWQRPLLRLDAGSLYDRYVGASERNLRETLRQAETMAPIVLWIDEIEKAFAGAASSSTDGGLSRRMFGALLTWMQDREAPVFIVATANDIEALPPELLRKGRFDEIFFVDLPEVEVRAEIFAIHLRKRGRDPASFDLAGLAAEASGFSGAEIEQAVTAGLHAAFASGRELTEADLVAAVRRSPPLSVTMSEKLAHLRAWAATRCVPAG
ncbi:MAG: AAA family ATPase [Phycisphaerales bacterium]|nr:AAA family ATPase [Phycisphaerales bacterium]